MWLVDYLLKASASSHAPRPTTAITIIVFYCILLLLLAIVFFRLLYTVTKNPGFVPRGPQWYANKGKEEESKSWSEKGKRKHQAQGEKTNGNAGLASGDYGNHAYPDGPPMEEYGVPEDKASNLRDFYAKDIFTCEGDGRPVWCSTCLNFKPDSEPTLQLLRTFLSSYFMIWPLVQQL